MDDMDSKKEAAAERLLKPLANRRRLLIMNFLRKRKEASVGDIAHLLDLSLAATSRHLSMLERAGYLEKEQRSLAVFYRLSSEAPALLAPVFAII